QSAMSAQPHNLGDRQPCAHPSRDRGMATVMKTEVFDFGVATGRREAALERIPDAEYRHVTIFRRHLPEPDKFGMQPGCHPDGSLLGGFAVHRRNRDGPRVEVKIQPAQFEYLAAPHPGVERANQDRAQMITAPDALVEQFLLFVERQDAIAARFVGLADDPLGALERRANDPTFAPGVTEDGAQ